MKKLINLFTLAVCMLLPCEITHASTREDILKDLRSYDRNAQIAAVYELGRIKDEKAIQTLLDFVFTKNEDWQVKVRAITILGEITDISVSDRLVTVFNDPFLNYECPAMKWYTAMALGQSFNKGTRAVDTLIDALNYDNLLIQEAAILSLGKTEDPAAVLYLLPLLEDNRFSIKYSAIKALERIGDPGALPFLLRAADKENDPFIKEETLRAMENIKKKLSDTH